MAQVLNTEFIAFLLLLFLFTRLNAIFCYAQLVLKGLRFSLPPSVGSIEALIPTNANIKRAKQAGKEDKYPVVLTTEAMTTTVTEVIDHNKAFLQAGRSAVHLDWMKLAMYEEYDTTVFTSIVITLLVLFSESWSCIRGSPPHSVSLVAISATGVVSLMYLAKWLLALGLWRHKEARLSVILGFVGALLCMAVLKYLQYPILDFPIDDSFTVLYKNVSLALGSPMREAEFVDDGSMFTLHLCIATAGGVITAILFLPALRYANTYFEAMQTATFASKLLLNAGFFSSAFLVLCWIRPLTSDYIEAPPEDDPQRYSVAFYDRVRLSFVLVACVCRLAGIRPHMQAYLKKARSRSIAFFVAELRIKRDGVDAKAVYAQLLAVCKDILRVLCVAGLQFICPVLIMASLALVWKRLAGIDAGVCAVYKEVLSSVGFSPAALHAVGEQKPALLDYLAQTALSGIVEGNNLTLQTFICPVFFRALMSFMVWWTALVWTVFSLFGFLYWEMVVETSAVLIDERIERAAAANPARESKKTK